jgi:hypothetical protein
VQPWHSGRVVLGDTVMSVLGSWGDAMSEWPPLAITQVTQVSLNNLVNLSLLWYLIAILEEIMIMDFTASHSKTK